ncbi:MAG TPA: hypothetical protein VGM41_08310 [Chitinophagaceae bacterium]|jgi:hypothetical protein
MDFDPEEEETKLDDCCPNCGRTYDEIDYEFQICHRCDYVNDNNCSIVETPDHG